MLLFILVLRISIKCLPCNARKEFIKVQHYYTLRLITLFEGSRCSTFSVAYLL